LRLDNLIQITTKTHQISSQVRERAFLINGDGWVSTNTVSSMHRIEIVENGSNDSTESILLKMAENYTETT